MDHTTASFVDGIGAAAATSGILSQQQGRIFAVLYLQDRPLSLDEIATELQQSKSNVSINVRGLVEWHLVRRRSLPGSRKVHYESATDFFRSMQAIFERRFRWTVRQVVAVVEETKHTVEGSQQATSRATLMRERLTALGAFFSLLDSGIGAFVQGRPFPAEELAKVVPLKPRTRRRRG